MPGSLLRCLALITVLGSAASLLVQPRFGAAAPAARALGAMRPAPKMQFGEPEKTGLTRDNEPEEFFSTNMDSMSDEEKFKSPVVIGGLALLISPFLIGAIALAFYR